MTLKLTHVSVGEPEVDAALSDTLEHIGAPDGEDWQGTIAASPTGGWEIVLDGAPRQKALHVDWEIVANGNGATRFRKLLHNKDERTVEQVHHACRKLLWETIQFKENPIRTMNPKLGSAFEEVVWRMLKDEDMRPLEVRFGVWREADGFKYVCKVEYRAVPWQDCQLPWSWWSALVRSPQDLGSELHKALQARRKRQAAIKPWIPPSQQQARRTAAGREKPRPSAGA